MRQTLARLVIALAVCASPRLAAAQDAQAFSKIYIGTAQCAISSGSGAPSAGTLCDVYIDTATDDVYSRRSGSWVLLTRPDALNVFTVQQELQAAEPILYLTETDQGSNLKDWRFDVNSQIFNLQTVNDAKSAVVSTLLSIDRLTGNQTVLGGIAAGGAISGTSGSFTGTVTVGGHALPATPYASNLGALNDKWLAGFIGELWTENLVAASVMATIGGRVAVAPTNSLTADRLAQLAVATPTVTPQGTAGSTTYSYKVSALDHDGESLPSSAGQTTTGNASLTVGHFNRITWAAVTGATSYAVYGRTSGSWLLVGTTASTTFDDTGAVTPSGSPQVTNGTARQFHTKYGTYASGDQPYMESNSKVEFLQVATWPISAVNTGAKTFAIGGDRTDVFTSGRTFAIVGSTGNNGNYTISTNSTYNVGTNLTTVTVTSTPASAVADGGVLVVSTGSDFVYFITRDRAAVGSRDWYAGDALLNTGTTGNGIIDLYSSLGILSGTGPTIAFDVRTGSAYNAIATRAAVGNLNGLYGYVADTYGFAAGDPSGANITIDATNGLRNRVGTTTYSQLSGSTFTLGNPSGNRVTWDNANLTVVSSNLTVDSTSVRVLQNPGSVFDPAHGYLFHDGSGNSYGMYGKEFFLTFGRRGLTLNNIGSVAGTDYGVALSAQSDTRAAAVALDAYGSTASGVNSTTGVDISATGSGGTSSDLHVIGDGTVTMTAASGFTVTGPVVTSSYINPSGLTIGRAGQGGTVSNSYSVYWTGSTAQLWIDLTNVGTITLTSDRRAKKNIEALPSVLAQVLQLAPVSFQWDNDNPHESTARQMGLIAQDVESIFPTLVTKMPLMTTAKAPDGLYRVDYVALVPVLVRAIQELQAEIVDLRGRVKGGGQ